MVESLRLIDVVRSDSRLWKLCSSAVRVSTMVAMVQPAADDRVTEIISRGPAGVYSFHQGGDGFRMIYESELSHQSD